MHTVCLEDGRVALYMDEFCTGILKDYMFQQKFRSYEDASCWFDRNAGVPARISRRFNGETRETLSGDIEIKKRKGWIKK